MQIILPYLFPIRFNKTLNVYKLTKITRQIETKFLIFNFNEIYWNFKKSTRFFQNFKKTLSIIIQGWWDSGKKISIAKQSDGATHNNDVSP